MVQVSLQYWAADILAWYGALIKNQIWTASVACLKYDEYGSFWLKVITFYSRYVKVSVHSGKWLYVNINLEFWGVFKTLVWFIWSRPRKQWLMLLLSEVWLMFTPAFYKKWEKTGSHTDWQARLLVACLLTVHFKAFTQV